jgi:hypothetical protein
MYLIFSYNIQEFILEVSGMWGKSIEMVKGIKLYIGNIKE